MALISKPYTFSAGATIVAAEHNSNFDTIYNEFNGQITNANISSSAAITDSKLAQISTAGKVSGAAFTNLSSIPSGAGVIPSANIPTVVTTNFRSGMTCKQASTTTFTVQPGIVEVNATAITKTSATTMTLTTAADWASGSSSQAVSTTGFVGVNSSGDIRLSTTAPTHAEYALSTTNGILRFASWSGTVYRIIGWFRMNATGSGELDAWGVSNLADIGVVNQVVHPYSTYASLGGTAIPLDGTEPLITEGNAISGLTTGFRASATSSKVLIEGVAHISASGNSYSIFAIFQDGASASVKASLSGSTNSDWPFPCPVYYGYTPASTTYTEFTFRCGDNGGQNMYINGSSTAGAQRFNGRLISEVRITEIP